MDRRSLKLPFTLKKPADWICPTCSKGLLRVATKTFNKGEGYLSRDHSYEAWEPEWIQFIFSCNLICTNDRCQEVVACAGTGGVEERMYYDQEGETQVEYEEFFKPVFFHPHLLLVNIPEECPETVSTPLKESFRLFLCAPGAASNNVRIAIEELLTDLKVSRFTQANGERRFIPLHQRITLLPKKFVHLKDQLLAIKWLGNAGSHSNGKITFDDVMDSYDLVEHILHAVYAHKPKQLAALAKRVNRKKGPAKVKAKP